MGYLAQWGPKGFLVSPTKIVPFNDFSTTVALKADSENDTSGTDPTNTRGLEPQVISLATSYMRAAGVDPRGQFEEWTSLVGAAHPLLIEGRRFGPPKMQLTQVSLSGVEFSNEGVMLLAEVSITLTELPDKTSTQSKAAPASAAKAGASTSATQAAGTYAATVAAKKQALNATASKADKAEKKPTLSRQAVMLN